MGSRGSFLESGGFSAPARWHTVDYVDGIKVLAPKDPKASISLPERSNTPGTAYVAYGNHEAEFEYSGTTYVLQPEVTGGKAYLVIWDCSPYGQCIAKHETTMEGKIPQSVIDAVLSEKCFDAKSFFEIEKDITVTVIY